MTSLTEKPAGKRIGPKTDFLGYTFNAFPRFGIGAAASVQGS
jgi:hypothetical protein